jgi:hypothetical protein
MGLVSNRFGRLGVGFAALYARWQAGTLRRSRRRASPREPRPSSSRPLDCLPRKRGWLAELLPRPGCHDARRLTDQLLSTVKNDPEMTAFLAAAPQAGRILRPLLRMLTPQKLPGALRLPVGRDSTRRIDAAPLGGSRPTLQDHRPASPSPPATPPSDGPRRADGPLYIKSTSQRMPGR